MRNDDDAPDLMNASEAIEYIRDRTDPPKQLNRQGLAGVAEVFSLPLVGGRFIYPRGDLDRIIALMNKEAEGQDEGEEEEDLDEELEDQ